jgi:hypothetical protein
MNGLDTILSTVLEYRRMLAELESRRVLVEREFHNSGSGTAIWAAVAEVGSGLLEGVA